MLRVEAAPITEPEAVSHRDPNSDQNTNPADVTADQSAAEHGAELVAAEQAFQLELEAGPILAEILSQGGSTDALGDELHAAVSALSETALDQLDPAAQHLIDSINLFDVPMDDGGDAAS